MPGLFRSASPQVKPGEPAVIGGRIDWLGASQCTRQVVRDAPAAGVPWRGHHAWSLPGLEGLPADV
ncbi:MAG: hypothetical protein ACP5G2_06720 [Candidatus Bipolaricaulaceae bacterium]